MATYLRVTPVQNRIEFIVILLDVRCLMCRTFFEDEGVVTFTL